MKASPIKYAAAKRIALTTIIKQPPDAGMPDRVEFQNEEGGFAFRVYHEGRLIEKFLPWSVISTSIDSVVRVMKLALDELSQKP